MKKLIKKHSDGTEEDFNLEDKDFLLITALNDLTFELKQMRLKNGA